MRRCQIIDFEVVLFRMEILEFIYESRIMSPAVILGKSKISKKVVKLGSLCKDLSLKDFQAIFALPGLIRFLNG